ncbi:MAG TPA: IscS subfamily cysteine desulfurase [Planctomycetaceae bacterium]|nr:IscS subfamily cysteine desulfurase [Planctomycetaceae bacterium]
MIYLDHHATTPVADEVLAAMLPYFTEHFGNSGSTTHQHGRTAAEVVAGCCEKIAGLLGGRSEQLVVTSGATESCNLAILGYCLHPRQKRRRVVSLTTEHPAVLDPLKRLEKHGFEIVRVSVQTQTGHLDWAQLESALSDDVALCSVMLANNEIGTIHSLTMVSELCGRHGIALHSDATQAVGRIPVDIAKLGIDLLSFSAHKFYGPKGVGGLLLGERRVRLHPQIVGGGQQLGRRSGTLNVPGIVGMTTALELCTSEIASGHAVAHQAHLRNQLWRQLEGVDCEIFLNGPSLLSETQAAFGDETEGSQPELERLPGNLNCGFRGLEGQSLMQLMPELSVSSGSACSSASPDVSHVLRAIGRTEDEARSSLRFGVGRQTTLDQIEQAAELVARAVQQLGKFNG